MMSASTTKHVGDKQYVITYVLSKIILCLFMYYNIMHDVKHVKNYIL